MYRVRVLEYGVVVPSFHEVSISYPKGMCVCEERIARAWVSARVLRYMYINIYTRVYIGKNMSEYSVPFSCKIRCAIGLVV